MESFVHKIARTYTTASELDTYIKISVTAHISGLTVETYPEVCRSQGDSTNVPEM